DRCCRLFDGSLPDLRDPALQCVGEARRPALADDVRLHLLYIEHVDFRPDHARMGLARASVTAGSARLRSTVRARAGHHTRTGLARTPATQARLGTVQPHA